MTSPAAIYAFRRTPEGMAIENINVFKQVYKKRFDVDITSPEIHAALADLSDVRDFSAGGQAKNYHMLAAACQERLANAHKHITGLLGSSGHPTPSFTNLVLCLVPPTNDDELYGIPRPNHYYNGQTSVDDSMARLNFTIAQQSGPDCFGFPLTDYMVKTQGHVYQYLRSIVLQYFPHQSSSKQAMKDWVAASNLTASSKSVHPPQTRAKRTQSWSEQEQETVISTLHRIHSFFEGSSSASPPSASCFPWTTFIRYLVEPTPDGMRDHFKTVVCVSIATALYGLQADGGSRVDEKRYIVDEQVAKGILEGLGNAGFIDAALDDTIPFAPATNKIQSDMLKEEYREEEGDEEKAMYKLYWRVCSRLAGIGHKTRPAKGHVAVASINRWKKKVERYPALHYGPFTTIDISLCDAYWLDGWPIQTMAHTISRVLGLELKYVQKNLAQLGDRWTYDAERRIVDDRLGMYEE